MKMTLALGRGQPPLPGPGAASSEWSCPMPGSERRRRAGSLLLAARVVGAAALGPVTCVLDVPVSQGCAEHSQEEIPGKGRRGSGPTAGGLAGMCWAIDDSGGLGGV